MKESFKRLKKNEKLLSRTKLKWIGTKLFSWNRETLWSLLQRDSMRGMTQSFSFNQKWMLLRGSIKIRSWTYTVSIKGFKNLRRFWDKIILTFQMIQAIAQAENLTDLTTDEDICLMLRMAYFLKICSLAEKMKFDLIFSLLMKRLMNSNKFWKQRRKKLIR